MKLLVTGGAGFMGSYFVKYVLRQKPEWEVITLDKLTYAGDTSKLDQALEDPRHTFIEGDITDGQHMEEIVSHYSVDVIVNFAAETHVDNSIEEADPFIRTNITGVHTLLEIANKYGIRMLQISTDEVYGSVEEGYSDERAAFRPNNPYSASKASADLLCRAYYQTYGVDVVRTHSCNIFGPYQHEEKFIPKCIRHILNGEHLPLHGDGLNVREWLYVEDHARAVLLVLKESEAGDVYNIGSYDELTNREMEIKILERMGKDPSWIQYTEDRQGNDRRYGLDSSKVRELGWDPQISFEEGLTRAVNWYAERLNPKR